MKGFETVIHKGKKITIVDLSNKKAAEQYEILKEAQPKIAAMPPKSALVITDDTNAEVSKEVVAAVMQFAMKNTPYVKASAAVGADKLKNVILLNITTSVGREIKNFSTRVEAMDWLVSQP